MAQFDSHFAPMSNNRASAPGTNTMGQQLNVDKKRGEDAARDAWLRKGGLNPQASVASSTLGPKRNLDGTSAVPGVKKPMMHSAVSSNTRQFGKSGLGRVATRVQGMLRRAR